MKEVVPLAEGWSLCHSENLFRPRSRAASTPICSRPG
ncbi:hypothetical protein SVIOM342S_05999 [Streptomyces violaceorubidus]